MSEVASAMSEQLPRGCYTSCSTIAVQEPLHMNRPQSAGNPARKSEPSALVRALQLEAVRRGDSPARLAQQLGLTARHWARWRTGEESTAVAKRPHLVAASRYLRVPVVAVLGMAGAVTLQDLEWPGVQSRELRLRMELDALLSDSYYGAFAPHSLRSASAEVQLFAVYLYREAQGASRATYTRPAYWSLLRDAADQPGPMVTNSDQSMY